MFVFFALFDTLEFMYCNEKLSVRSGFETVNLMKRFISCTFRKNEYELLCKVHAMCEEFKCKSYIQTRSLASNSQSFANIHCLVI